MNNRPPLLARLAVLASLLLASLVAAASSPQDLKKKSSWYWQQYKQQAKLQTGPGAPVFQDVSVHDPSVIRVGDAWYVFGSHLAAAKTNDLLSWQSVADGVNANNPLFDNVITELEDIFAWSGAYGLWANDVIEMPDGRFCMYPNLSQADAPRASIGLAVADDVEGPYEYQGIFLQSGMWDEISEDGVNVYDPQIHPNTIDPDAFFDYQGNFWMVYGSYSGGIFILEMDPDTCLPLPGQGYGTHLMGGNHSRIEGPYVLYSPHSAYYYLFVTFGGLDANGGYNMRVARSLYPDGPYYDALGNDMADVKSNPNLPLFDDASIEPYAQKLMGNFLFLREAGELGTGQGTGYVSPGHNSAYYDEETGRYFLIFHTRFPGTGEFHEVRVHQLFINADGWPVVAPHRWVPYTHLPYRDLPYRPGSYPFYMENCRHKDYCWNVETVSFAETPGDYKVINHGKEISAAITNSELVSLLPNGSVSGAYSGSWQRSWNNRITLGLDGVGLFEGVMSRGWNELSQQFVVTFTVQSIEGISIWGSQK